MNIGFLQERPGVWSITRLVAAGLGAGSVLAVLTACGVAIRGGEHAAGIIAALSTCSASSGAGAWAALRERTATAPDVEGV